jgi:hypothetical protein
MISKRFVSSGPVGLVVVVLAAALAAGAAGCRRRVKTAEAAPAAAGAEAAEKPAPVAGAPAAAAPVAGAPAAPPAPKEKPRPAGTPHVEEILEAWRKAGLGVEAPQKVAPGPYRAAHCEGSRVSGVETLICEYPDDQTVDAARKIVQARYASAPTAVVLRNGRTLLAAADRARVDPNGKAMSKLSGEFVKLR